MTCGRRLGYLLESLEDNTRGIEVRAASMERDSRGWGNTHLSRGMTLLAMRRPRPRAGRSLPAVESLERAVGATHRFTLTARLMRMVALAQVGRTDQALAEAAALAAMPEAQHPSLFYDAHAGTVYRLAGRPVQAFEAQQRALHRIPDDPVRRWNLMRVLVERGLTELELGLVAESQGSLDEALALSATEQRRETPMRADAWLGLGRALSPPSSGSTRRRSRSSGPTPFGAASTPRTPPGSTPRSGWPGWIAGWAIDARQRLRLARVAHLRSVTASRPGFPSR